MNTHINERRTRTLKMSIARTIATVPVLSGASEQENEHEECNNKHGKNDVR